MSVKALENHPEKKSIKRVLFNRLHILEWLPKYSKSDIVADFIAGLTVGLTMMPQSIAYANLAGLPAQYGLYTAFIGSFTYILFGTIKEVSIGPTSLMALLTLSYTEGLHVDYVILLTLLAGLVEFSMGVLKLGFLVEFISPCVTSGFTSAMSLTIAISQIKNLLGLRKLQNHGVFDVIFKVFHKFDEIRLADTLLGIGCIAFLFLFKQLPKIKTRNGGLKKTLWFLTISKNALVVFLTSLLAFLLHEYGSGSPFILSGTVPSGIPLVQIPHFSTNNGTTTFTEMVQTLGSSIIVVPTAAIVANVAIAKAFASGVLVDATQEMISLGLCNIFGSFVQAMPSCGAFTRSAVASSSGVQTPLQGIYSGTVILLALSFLTPYFYYIPRTTLAAVLISAIITMFDYEIFPKLWKYHRFDFFLTLTTLLVGVFYGVEVGIVAGGLFNLLILVKVWVRPQIIRQIRLDEKGEEFIYIKPEVGLYYAGADYFTTKVLEANNICTRILPIIIDCGNVIKIDYASCKMLENLVNNLHNKNRNISLVNLQSEIYGILANTVNLNGLKLEIVDEIELRENLSYGTPLLKRKSFCDEA